VLGVGAAAGATFGLRRLRPAAPTVERGTVLIGTVKRGRMIRQVRGQGTLVPQVVRWIPAPAEGRIERVLVQPGAEVGPNTVIAELSNPQLEQQAIDADFQVKTAEAEEQNLRVRLQSDNMAQQAAAASINAEYSQAKLQLDTDEVLGKQGLVPELLLKVSRVHVQDLANRLKIEQQRLAISGDASKAQLNAQRSRMEQLRALAKLKHEQVDSLKVRAGTLGVVQEVSVQVGQQMTLGLNMARLADPTSLKAELRIAETQMKDIKIGQYVEIDTRNGTVDARVVRIDPAAREGTVVVDAALNGDLPPGARADLSIDGTIELERLEDILYVERPAFGQGQQTISLFKLEPDGQDAAKVKVSLGRSSVSTIEVLSGLREGDQVILSDTSAWDSYDRIRLR
jgi:HlyD family secretion protein